MTNIITIIQVAAAALLTGAILMQRRGAGLSGTFGGSDGVYATRRGIEHTLFIATIVLAVIFIGASIARILV